MRFDDTVLDAAIAVVMILPVLVLLAWRLRR